MLKDRLQALTDDRAMANTRRWYPSVVAMSMSAATIWLGSMTVLGISLVSSGLCAV